MKYVSLGRLSHLLISESGLYDEDEEYNPLDGQKEYLIDIVMKLLIKWEPNSVLNWLLSVYESYL